MWLRLHPLTFIKQTTKTLVIRDGSFSISGGTTLRAAATIKRRRIGTDTTPDLVTGAPEAASSSDRSGGARDLTKILEEKALQGAGVQRLLLF
jgi:hypothetical protein